MAQKPQPRRLADFLDGRRGMASLAARSRHHAVLHRLVQRRLPGFVAEHCLACVAGSDGQLIVFTDSPAWATRLRFALPAILSELQHSIDAKLRGAQVRILSDHRAVPVERPAMVPGRSVIRQVQDTADCCDSPELRASLLRLAATWHRVRS